ncbi:hypothetical protein JCGZ_03583 [Jatropha curcas]|uniref:Uncharacterized protein n=1 Tax=Jatropha curcas TaxID=180498 RepID=A0A067JD28_JATCU|nr:hypothetical protein JCGZ_03583 [Jatropha curcas]
MSHLPEIPTSAYTPEMETLGAIPDIPTFDGEPVPVSRNPLTSGTRPLQLLPLPGTEFPIRYETSRMCGFQTELCDADVEVHSATVEVRGTAVEVRGAATEVRYAAILQGALRSYSSGGSPGRSVLDCYFRSSVGPFSARCDHPDPVWAYEYRIYPGGPSSDTPVESRWIPRYLVHCHHTYANTEDPEYWRSFLNDRGLFDLFLTPWEGEAWRTYPGREVAELYTRSRLLLQGDWLGRCFLGERVCDIEAAPAQRQARLLEVLEYTQERKKHRTAAHYRVEAAAETEAATANPAGPAVVVLGDVPFPPSMEVVLDPGLGLGCQLRNTESCASGSGLLDPSLPSSILSGMRGIWRSEDCGGTSLASPVLWPDSRWRWIGSRLCWRWRGSLWTSPRRMMAPLPMMHHRLHPLRRLLVRAGGVDSSASVF